ncbi:MAG: endo-1,4-beta-xylanase [Azonexus sp.]|nr:endo-1,4-beta-xylanase [Azonexus sp.]
MKKLIAFLFAAGLLASHHASAVKESNVAKIPLQYFGLHIHRADAGTAWPNVPFGSWRLWDAYVGWAQLETTRGQWSFARLDRYVAVAKLTNVELLLPLAMTPIWASARPQEASAYRPGNSAEPANMNDWRAYVTMVGTRYKGKIRQYEIWNEPSDMSHYTGSVEKLVEMTCEAHRILKDIDPNNLVISPASAGGGKHIDYLDHFLAIGGKRCIDVVAHHFYVFQKPPEAMLPLIRGVRTVMGKHGLANMPLWNTETGWWIANGDGTPDHQMVAKGGWRKLSLETESGDYVLRALLLARAEGVDRFYWYSWDNRYGLGMIEASSGNPKPMVAKWRTTVDRLHGATQLKCAQSGKYWSCDFIRKDGVADQVTWSVE